MASQFRPEPPQDQPGSAVPLGGTRAQAIKRLQIGVGGLVGMVLLVGLASSVLERAKENDAAAVPEAVATVAGADEGISPGNDPLADAGVVPVLPTQQTQQDPVPVPTPSESVDLDKAEDGATD